MKTLMIAVAMVMVTAGSAWAQEQAGPAPIAEPTAWRNFANALPAGEPVAVRLKDGREYKGTIVEVRNETLLFKPRTRVPVPAGEIAFVDVDSIVRRGPGMSPGTKVALGVGAAAATILTVGIAVLAATGY